MPFLYSHIDFRFMRITLPCPFTCTVFSNVVSGYMECISTATSYKCYLVSVYCSCRDNVCHNPVCGCCHVCGSTNICRYHPTSGVNPHHAVRVVFILCDNTLHTVFRITEYQFCTCFV